VCKTYLQTKVFDAKNKAGCTPLELAFTHEHLECCNILRAAQTSLNRQRTEFITETTTLIDQVTVSSADTSRRASQLTSGNNDLRFGSFVVYCVEYTTNEPHLKVLSLIQYTNAQQYERTLQAIATY